MPIVTIGDKRIKIPEGMSVEEATKIFESSQQAADLQKKIKQLPPGTGGTGTPLTEQAQSELPAEMMQNMPVLASLILQKNPAGAVKSAGKLALITGLSSLTASELRERYEDPEYQGTLKYLLRKGQSLKRAGGESAGAFLGDRYFMPWLGKRINSLKNLSVRPLVSKVFGGQLPKRPAREVTTAQDFLRIMKPKHGRPFSLTWDQIHQGQENFHEQLGSIARSGWFSAKIPRENDLLNEEAVSTMVEGLMRSGKKRHPRLFGLTLAMLFNRDKGFMKYQTNALYNKFRQMAYDKGIEVNLVKAYDVLRENMDNRFVRRISAKIFSSDPAIVRSLKNGEAMMRWKPEELEIFFGQLPKEEMRRLISEISATVPLETAADMYHNINYMFGKVGGGVGNYASQFKREMGKAFDISLTEVPGSYAMFNRANAWATKSGARLEKKIIERIFSKIDDETPSSIVEMFESGIGIDHLKSVERFFRTSGKLEMADFEKNIISPLRHRFLSGVVNKTSGKFTGAKLSDAIETSIEKNGPEYLEALYGKGSVDFLKKAAATLNVIESTKKSSIVIKTIQAGVLMGGAGLIGTGKNVDSETLQAFGLGAVAIGLIPWALARIMSDPRLMRTLTDGMVAGYGTSKFARAVMMAVNQNKRALTEMKNKSPEALDFYDNIYEGRPEEREQEFAQPTLGDIEGTAGAFFPEQPLQ